MTCPKTNIPKILKLLKCGLVLALCLTPVLAQSLSLNMGDGGPSATGRLIQLVALITILSLAPSIIVIVTSFTRIVVVFSFLRSAIGLQQSPPNMVLISLSLFLTFFIMQPTFEEAYKAGIQPLMSEKIKEEEAFNRASMPFHAFMLKNVREKDLHLFLDLSKVDAKKIEPKDTPFRALVPAFIISELKRAFEIGFLIFLPFLIIDMVVASILMAMGMMMLPPVMIALPFKLIFFVLVDGWHMLSASLINSFAP